MAERTEVLFLRGDNLAECAGKVAESLRGGSLCVIPTDTIYGIVALDRLPESVERIYRIKRRPKDKPFIRLIGGVDILKDYTDQPFPALLAGYWPGPLTVVFRGKGGERVALRFPDDPFLKTLFVQLDYSPLVAPSANMSGEQDIYDCSELVRTFFGKVDLILCREGGVNLKKTSTILDISEEPWKLLREGALKIDPRALKRETG